MAIVDDDDAATTSIADDDRSEIQQYHWQTDIFNNMDIDEVHKKWSLQLFQSTLEKNYLYYKWHYSETKTVANIFIGAAWKSRWSTRMEENDLRIIATEPTSLDITSVITDDNEHVNGS